VWVHRRETGLYRVSSMGPELKHPASDLPVRGIHNLLRSRFGLVAVASDGIRRIGDPTTRLAPQSTDEFLGEHFVASVDTLWDGTYAIGTLKGIAILNGSFEIVRIISSADGLPSPTVNRAHSDTEGNLWLATQAGFYRVPAGDAVARVAINQSGAQASVDALSTDARGLLWISAGGELLRLPVSPDGSFPIPTKVAELPRRGTSFEIVGDSLLIGRHGGIDFYSGGKTKTLQDIGGLTVYGFLPLRERNGSFLVRDYAGVSLLTPADGGTWHFSTLARFPAGATSAAEDAEGRVWLGAWEGALLRLDLATGKLEEMRPARPGEAAAGGGARVAGAGDHIFAAAGEGLLRFDPRSGAIEPVAVAPPVRARLLQLSPDRRRLYVAFDRPAGSLAPHGLGVLDLDESGRPAAWRDLAIPALASIGTPQALHVVAAGGRDTVWLGGSQGLFRLRPAEIAAWNRPRPPRLLVDDAGRKGGPPVYAFARHRVALEVRPIENATRPLLRLETRFGDETGWTPAGPQTQFTFSSLSEGTYTFAARVRNPADQVGEPTQFTFRIAPPWYRTPAAYGGAALLALAAGAGAIRLRERRSRQRTAELERLVRERTAELEQANAAKDEFLASMSHEIRNPLNGVVGLSAAIDTAGLDGEGRHRFDLLRHCAAHLSSLLEDILDFSRLQSGSVDLLPQPFAPAELLASVEAITAADSAAAGVPVRTAVAANVPPHLVGDARRLRQVLLNLVTNGLKYAGRGTIEVTAWSRPAGNDTVELTFAVSDEGPGIPPEEQARVFTKFERGAAARQARIPGTGMGLAVCRTLAERMGGRVWVESTPGAGATFYLCVPLPVATEPPAPGTPLDHALLAVRKPALVVDDEDYNRVALGALLGQLGFEVTTARDAAGALALVGAGRSFAAIFLDYDLPGLTGPELARRLRAEHARHGDQPVILASTAYTTVEKRRECLAAGMDGFVGKPVTADKIRQALGGALASRRPPGASHLAPPAEEPAEPAGADPLANLRVLAATRRRPLAEEFTAFAADCARDFAAWREAADRRDAFAAARTAHQLAGRFGFVRAAGATTLALELETACTSHRWDDAATLAAALAAEWQRVEAPLRIRSAGPAA
jgi:signal transduction histidine kinase/CheY-like chemotaxis protein/ligand-binding sensor domain-containing protein/HPt (histidine-containing phosphotransfer) domain-containing protein